MDMFARMAMPLVIGQLSNPEQQAEIANQLLDAITSAGITGFEFTNQDAQNAPETRESAAIVVDVIDGLNRVLPPLLAQFDVPLVVSIGQTSDGKWIFVPGTPANV